MHTSGPPPPPPTTTITCPGPTREKLESLQELVIQRVTVADILTFTQGSITVAWLIRGDGLISVSLTDAVISKLDPVIRSATIELPVPRMLSARIDHERSMFWDLRQGLFNRLNPWGASLSDIETPAMRAAQKLVERAVDSPEHHQQARALTTTLVTNLYATFGWTVSIHWREPESATVDQPSR